MKQRRKLNKKSIRLLILILGLIVLVVSTSYAVFSIRHENSNNQIISAGELELTYNSCSTMTTEMVPMSNEDGIAQVGCNVTVENTGSLDAIYKVLIYNNSSGSNHLSHDNLYISINSSTPVLLSTITKLEDTEKYNLKEDVLLVGNTRSHNIKMWIKEDATTDIVGKSVNLIVDIEAVVLEEVPESYEYVYTGTVQEFTVPATGYYDVELWGAEGNKSSTILLADKGGSGGYSKGTIYLEKNEKLYFYVGQKGANYQSGGWNGGGISLLSSDLAYTGGGATDVRLVKASSTDDAIWNESTSLRSRIMVAGGGGSTTYHTPNPGGNGGGLYGTPGMYEHTGATNEYFGQGGSQVDGGPRGNPSYATTVGTSGEFGIGGQGSLNSSYANNGGSGGGGGYYGGGGGASCGEPSCGLTSGGGSSYISGYAGVMSIQETGGIAEAPLYTNNTLHYSGKYFIKGSMQAGINTGNGKAKITFIGSTIPERTNNKLDNVRYIKSCSTSNSNPAGWTVWNELQVIKNGINIAYGKSVTGDMPSHTAVHATYGNITDGDISGYMYGHGDNAGANCIYLDLGTVENVDEIGIWTFYEAERRTPDSYTLLVSADNSNWITIHDLTNHVATSQGLHYTAWD